MPSKLVNRPAPEAGTGSDTPDFESIYDALPIPVVLLDGRRRILRVNQAFEQCFELTQLEVAGREEPQFSAIAAALEEPGPAPDKPAGQAGGVHRFVTASGRHLEVNIKASTLIRGRQRFSVLLCQEPREYSQNATLQLSQADVFRLTIEQSPVPTTIQDAQFRILLANRATCELFGMTQEELLGTDPTYLYSEDSLRAGLLDRQRVRESTSDPTAVKIVGVRELVNPRTGEAISFRAEATRVIGLNGETMWCAMLFDLRKTLALETRLRAQIEWMERAFDNAPVGMLVTRAGNGSLVRVNKTLSQITGLTDEAKLSALAGKVIAQERHVLADGRGERRRHVQSRRFSLTNGNGEQQWLDGFATELTSAEGESVIITVINDATREQLLKNELSTSLMQQSALLRCMDAGMAHVVGEIVVQVNPALLEMIGKPEAQVLGQPLEALFGEPNNWRRLESAALAALDQTGLYRTTERILRADGSVRRCEVTLRRINENRADLGVLVTLTDVSDLLEQADLLRQSIDDMQVFSNVGTVGVATLDTGRLVHANDVMATLLARPPEQLVGARFADYCEADPALQLETLLDASGGLVRETVLRASLLRTEQSAIDCLLHVTPVTNGDRALVTVVAVDLNQRNAALALAVRMHLRFDAFAASLNEAVVVLAPGCGEIIHANPAAGEVFGIEPAILLRLSSSRLWTGVASESRPQLEQALSDLSIGKPSVTVVSMEHPDGRQMTVRLRMFGGDPGHPEHYLLAEDISEERQQERRRLEEAPSAKPWCAKCIIASRTICKGWRACCSRRPFVTLSWNRFWPT